MTEQEHFIELLTGNKNSKMAFRGIFDPGGDESHKAMNVYGSLKDHEPALRAWNSNKYGIFCTINETNGAGKSETDIIAVRAFFIDLDGGKTWASVKKEDSVEPTMVIKTAHGEHVYWVLAVADEQVEYFGAVQLGLVERYGSDPKVVDLPRVLRVPGFNHCKGDPISVVISEVGGTKYAADELIEKWDLDLEDLKLRAGEYKHVDRETVLSNTGATLSDADFKLAYNYTKNVLMKNTLADGRKNQALSNACALLLGFNCSEEQCLYLLQMWNNKCCTPALSNNILKEKIKNADKYGTEPRGARLIEARKWINNKKKKGFEF